MTDNTLPALPTCLNCGCALTDAFCSRCGQQDREIKRPLTGLLRELIHAIFELDGRAYRTIFFLFSKPGYLTREYISGRRASFTPPLRLFLILSITFFFIISLNSFIQTLDSSLAPQSVESTAGGITTDEDGAVTIDLNAIDDEDQIDFLDEDQDGLTEITDFIESLVLPFLSSETNANLVTFISVQAKTNYAKNLEDPALFFYGSLDYITFFMLLMMPFLAMIMKILYFFSKRFYVEHMILTLHNHTFLILAMMIRMPLSLLGEGTVMILSPLASLASALLAIWMMVYLYLSLKVYFGQGYLLTTFKFITATISYGILLAIGSAVFMALFFIFS